MTDRTDLHRAFAERFHAGERFEPATPDQLANTEVALGILWPTAFREFAMAWGAVYTPDLLDLVVDRETGFADVQNFLTPEESVAETRGWQLDPTGGCAAFASDCSGSFLAFRHLPSTEPRPDDAAVWLFDHENDEVVEQAPSFDEWLRRFLQL